MSGKLFRMEAARIRRTTAGVLSRFDGVGERQPQDGRPRGERPHGESAPVEARGRLHDNRKGLPARTALFAGVGRHECVRSLFRRTGSPGSLAAFAARLGC